MYQLPIVIYIMNGCIQCTVLSTSITAVCSGEFFLGISVGNVASSTAGQFVLSSLEQTVVQV